MLKKVFQTTIKGENAKPVEPMWKTHTKTQFDLEDTKEKVSKEYDINFNTTA